MVQPRFLPKMNKLQLWKISKNSLNQRSFGAGRTPCHPWLHRFQPALYPRIPVPSRGGSSIDASVNLTTETSNRCLPRFIILPSSVLTICIFPLLGKYLSNYKIIFFYSNILQILWRRIKCLTQRFTLNRILVWICAMASSTLSRWNNWYATPEPVTGFVHCGL